MLRASARRKTSAVFITSSGETDESFLRVARPARLVALDRDGLGRAAQRRAAARVRGLGGRRSGGGALRAARRATLSARTRERGARARLDAARPRAEQRGASGGARWRAQSRLRAGARRPRALTCDRGRSDAVS